MKKIYSLIVFASIGFTAHSQSFWTEDFGTGCNQGNLASAYAGSNGSWTIASTGTNDPDANPWFVSATEAGTGVGNCGAGCGSNSTLTNRTLHVGSTAIPALGLPADQGASYNAGGLCSSFAICVITNSRAESPVINCANKTNITLTFNYFENGDLANDDGSVWFYDGTTWALLQNTAKTTLGNCAPQGKWTAISIVLPASANNNPNVKIGFNWTNNDDGVGTDPSFAVDDIALTQSPSGIATITNNQLNVVVLANGQITIIPNGQAYKMLAVYDMVGREIKFTQTENTISLGNTAPGIYIINLDVNGTRVVKKVVMN